MITVSTSSILFLCFRCCVINNVSAPKLLFITVTCQMDARKSRTMSFIMICGILWHPVCTHFSVIQPSLTILCTLRNKCLALWQHQHPNVSVLSSKGTCTPHIICGEHAWHPGHYPSTSVLSLLKAMQHTYTSFRGIAHTTHTFTNWQWFSLVPHPSHTKIKTHFIRQSSPWFWYTIHL